MPLVSKKTPQIQKEKEFVASFDATFHLVLTRGHRKQKN